MFIYIYIIYVGKNSTKKEENPKKSENEFLCSYTV